MCSWFWCFPAAEIEGGGEIDFRGGHAIINQHVLADGVHGPTAGLWMHASAGTEGNARHAICGEVHSIRAWPPDYGISLGARYGILCIAERLNDWQGFVQCDRRIADVDIKIGSGVPVRSAKARNTRLSSRFTPSVV